MTNPAAALARALGDVDAMDALYHDDVSLYLPRSAGARAGPYRGRAVVRAFHEETFGVRFYPDVAVTILDTLRENSLSAARIHFSARFRENNADYENEYTFFVRSREGLIHEIFEGIDTLALARARGLVP